MCACAASEVGVQLPEWLRTLHVCALCICRKTAWHAKSHLALGELLSLNRGLKMTTYMCVL